MWYIDNDGNVWLTDNEGNVEYLGGDDSGDLGDYGDYSECGCWPWTAGEMFVTASFRLIPTEYVVTFDPGLGEGIRTEYVWAGETVVPPEEAPECRGARGASGSPVTPPL